MFCLISSLVYALGQVHHNKWEPVLLNAKLHRLARLWHCCCWYRGVAFLKHFDWKKNACYETTTLQRVNHSRKSQTGGGKKLESDEKKKVCELSFRANDKSQWVHHYRRHMIALWSLNSLIQEYWLSPLCETPKTTSKVVLQQFALNLQSFRQWMEPHIKPLIGRLHSS